MRRELFFILGLMVLFSLSFVSASCAEIKSVQDEFRNSSAVFSGKVIELKLSDNERTNLATIKSYVFWKGEHWVGIGTENNTVLVSTGNPNSISVGYRFEVGEEYLVYASDFDNVSLLTTNICSRTIKFENAAEDILILDGLKNSAPLTSECSSEGEMCGGIAGFACCSGLECQLDGDFPDAGGTCVIVGTEGQICDDLCGDGTCQEVVCLGEGCPCVESIDSCSADCHVAVDEESGKNLGLWDFSYFWLFVIIFVVVALIMIGIKIAKWLIWAAVIALVVFVILWLLVF